MAHYLDLFSPETYQAFSASDRRVSGFRIRHRRAASRISDGDLLVCYMTRLSRWFGLLRVDGRPFEDSTPIFAEAEDPFVVRFRVTPEIWLPPEHGIPIHADEVWSKLSFTAGREHGDNTWTGHVRSSLAPIADADGALLEQLLRRQGAGPKVFDLSAADQRALRGLRVRRQEGEVAVSVPENAEAEPAVPTSGGARESIKIQALLGAIGAQMGFKIWIPAPDRAAVLGEQPGLADSLLERLPLNYDETTLRTIEYIDVLWMRGRSMARAFEVEHSTAIYSGILRMADLLALQPNMDIRLHIVAPEERRQKVFEEILRPVFSLLEGRPLAERCTFLSYGSVRELAQLDHLAHLSDSVVGEYEEEAGD